MRKMVMAAALAVATMAGAGAMTLYATQAEAQASAGLSGDWVGGYISADKSDVNTFNVKLTQAGRSLLGTVYEVNAFGDSSRALFLTSTVTGSINGSQVRFTKTYDGSGGVSHAVSYVGTLDAGGRRIRGTYDASGTTGTFEMVRN